MTKHLSVSVVFLLITPGCTRQAGPARLPTDRAEFAWDVSDNRDAAAFPWFDFDPDYGAIDEAAHVTFKFDQHREFKGNTDLVTFSRASDTAATIESFHVNLPPQTSAELIDTLRTLASSWRLDTKRLDQDAQRILDGRDYRGIILYERNVPTIDVSIHNSFNDQRPYSITIQWSWYKPASQ